MTTAKKLLAADAIALVLYAVAATPSLTGVPLHEWAGLLILAVLFIHCCVHAGWVARVLKNGGRRIAVKLVMGLALLVTLMLTVVSGIMVSGTVLPLLGLYAPGYYFWNPLHATAAKLLLALLLVHLALHAQWIIGMLRKDRRNGQNG